jgi:hypothetical protein
MHIHEAQHDTAGAGRWDKTTGRYIPMGGGSRSRLPIYGDDPTIRRYYGFVGMDEKLTESISTIAGLYAHIGGAPKIESGTAGTLASRILDVVEEQRKIEEEALAAAAKAEKIAQLSQPKE